MADIFTSTCGDNGLPLSSEWDNDFNSQAVAGIGVGGSTGIQGIVNAYTNTQLVARIPQASSVNYSYFIYTPALPLTGFATYIAGSIHFAGVGNPFTLSNRQTSAYYQADGRMYWTAGGNLSPTIAGPSTVPLLTAGAFAEIRVQIVMHTSNGSIKVWKDGVQVINATGIPTAIAADYLDGVEWALGSTIVNALDDVRIWDEKRGSIAVGEDATVSATNAALFAMSGRAETNAVAQSFKVVAPGGIVLDGPVSIGGISPVSALNDLSDVTVASPAADQVLAYSGSAWVNTAPIMRRATVTLTNQQVKDLPTTAVTLVAAQGAGTQPTAVLVNVSGNTSAGAYTNINAAASMVIAYQGGPAVTGFVVNDAAIAGSKTRLTDLIGTTTNRTVRLSPYADTEGVNGWGPVAEVKATSASTNVPIVVSIDNVAAGVLTGGNAANTLTFTVIYVVL